MKNIKDITISIFAIIGFVAIVTGFTNEAEQPQQMYATPESHVWSFHISDPSGGGNVAGSKHSMAFAINKVTGEVRKYETFYNRVKNSPYGGFVIAPCQNCK
tara:strand:- start:39 stop:344 length:306 start_codon:yes stop_codon:yes gene_type:complete